jgi:hypothetical protein
MKKNVLSLVFILLFALSVFSQEGAIIEEDVVADDIVLEVKTKVESESQSTVIFNGSPYDFIFSWKKKAKKSHWTGFGVAFSNLTGLGDVALDLSRSYSIVLNVGDYIIPFSQHWLMATGFGFDWNRYHFRGNNSLQVVDGRTNFYPDEEGRDYRNSKFRICYATIPLFLEYQTKFNRGQQFFVYGGVEGLVRLGSKSQAEIETPTGNVKEVYKSLNLLPLNFRFIGRLGFEHFSVFGYYQPFSMFEKGRGPEIHPYGIGLMLNF